MTEAPIRFPFKSIKQPPGYDMELHFMIMLRKKNAQVVRKNPFSAAGHEFKLLSGTGNPGWESRPSKRISAAAFGEKRPGSPGQRRAVRPDSRQYSKSTPPGAEAISMMVISGSAPERIFFEKTGQGMVLNR